jgi:hypothetical protein
MQTLQNITLSTRLRSTNNEGWRPMFISNYGSEKNCEHNTPSFDDYKNVSHKEGELKL